MNYLGHLYFSGKDSEIIFGNFIGDYVKGNVENLDFSDKIKEGIKLHRKIDKLTDSNEFFLNSKKLTF